MSSDVYSPSSPDLQRALSSLIRHGLSLQDVCGPGTPLFSTIRAHAPHWPLQIYALAAHYDLRPLAVEVSSHLLGLPLSSIPDEVAMYMGPIYLKRFVFLHLGRSQKLKSLLLQPPERHVPNLDCTNDSQRELARAWALAAAHLAWDARPDTNVAIIEGALRPLGDYMACQICKHALGTRVDELVKGWLSTKVTFVSLNPL